MNETAIRPREAGIGSLFRASLLRWGMRNPRSFLSLVPAAWQMRLAEARRERSMRGLGLSVPYVVAVSPTMRCNYRCFGCYSNGRSTHDELSESELDSLFTEAAGLGVLSILVTGGEPLLRPELLSLIERHRRLFFVLITNGSLVNDGTARRLARANALTLVSIEGEERHTDARRGTGAHAAAGRALGLLRGAKAFHGFAATACADNWEYLSSDAFVDAMTAAGCATGYFTEYVPCDASPRADWLLDEASRAELRRRVLDLRGRKAIVLVQFPHDEYGRDNICSAAGKYSVHIGPNGALEPCPFVPVSLENVRNGGLAAALRSPFLRAIRERPGLLRRERLACALFEHLNEIERLAASVSAETVAAPSRDGADGDGTARSAD